MTEHQQFDPEELAEYLDKHLPPNQTSLPHANGNPLVNMAVQIAKDATPPPLSADAMARIRAKVLQANQQMHPQPELKPELEKVIQFPTTTVLRFVGSMVAMFLAVLIPIASAQSIPGNPLYSLKRGFEDVELAVAAPFNQQSGVYVTHAERRAREAIILSSRGLPNDTLIQESLENLSHAAGDTSTLRVHLLLEYVDEGKVQVFQVDNGNTQNPPATEDLPTIVASANTPESVEPPSSQSNAPEQLSTNNEDNDGNDNGDVAEPNIAQPNAASTPEPDFPANVVTFAEPTPAYIYTYANANLRLQPELGAFILAQGAPLTKLSIWGISQDGQWLYVVLADGSVGWIYRSLVAEGDTPPDKTPPPPTAIQQQLSSSDDGGQSDGGGTDSGTDGGGTDGGVVTNGGSSNSSGSNGGGSDGGDNDDDGGNSNGNSSGNSEDVRQDGNKNPNK